MLPTGSWKQKSTGQNRASSAWFIPTAGADSHGSAQGSAHSVSGRQMVTSRGERRWGLCPELLCPELQQGAVRGAMQGASCAHSLACATRENPLPSLRLGTWVTTLSSFYYRSHYLGSDTDSTLPSPHLGPPLGFCITWHWPLPAPGFHWAFLASPGRSAFNHSMLHPLTHTSQAENRKCACSQWGGACLCQRGRQGVALHPTSLMLPSLWASVVPSPAPLYSDQPSSLPSAVILHLSPALWWSLGFFCHTSYVPPEKSC